MLKRKIKVIMALSMSFCILASQTAMAASYSASSYSRSESAEVIVNAIPATEVFIKSPEKEVKKEEIKTKISREEAQKIAKSFDFSDGYEISYINLEKPGGDSQAVWRIELNSSSKSQYMSNISISISADTGELLNYYNWQYTNNKKNIAVINKKQAQEIADKFMKDYAKIDAKDLVLNNNYGSVYEKSNGIYEVPSYNFSYGVKVNGILAGEMMYSVQISASTGKVLNFSTPYAYTKPIKYPSADGVKDEVQLKNKFAELLKMQMMYMITYDNNKPKASLVYYPYFPGVLNAKTLESYIETYPGYTGKLSDNKEQINPSIKPDNKAITEAEAEKIMIAIKKEVEDLTGVKFEDQQIRSNYSFTTDEINKSYNVSILNTNYGFNITVSLATGNITGFSYYSYNLKNSTVDGIQKQQEVKENVNYKNAKKISDELIKKLFQKQYGLFSDVNLEPDNNEFLKTQQNHQFVYIKYENGITANNTISVSIDKETGKPTQIYMSWSDMDYPEPDKIISQEKAKEIYLKEAKFDLAYYTPFTYSKDGTATRMPEGLIIYRPDNITASKYIDAFTGELTDFSGVKLQDKYVNESHWAANSIEMLGVQGILLSNVTDYDMKLTRQDAVKMLALTVGIQPFNYEYPGKESFPDVKKENPYFSYVESAVSSNIIAVTGNKFDGGKIITKQEFTVMLLNTLGYKELLKHSGLFAASGRDIYYNICDALDILPVKPGETYKSTDELTFAEAAYSLQRALKYFR